MQIVIRNSLNEQNSAIESGKDTGQQAEQQLSERHTLVTETVASYKDTCAKQREEIAQLQGVNQLWQNIANEKQALVNQLERQKREWGGDIQLLQEELAKLKREVERKHRGLAGSKQLVSRRQIEEFEERISVFLGTGSLMGREDVGVAIMRQCMEDMKRKLEATQVKLQTVQKKMKKVSRKNQEKELYYKAKIVQFDQLVAKLYSLVQQRYESQNPQVAEIIKSYRSLLAASEVQAKQLQQQLKYLRGHNEQLCRQPNEHQAKAREEGNNPTEQTIQQLKQRYLQSQQKHRKLQEELQGEVDLELQTIEQVRSKIEGVPITVQSYSLRAFSNDKLQQLNDNLRKLEKIVTLKHNLLSHKNECLKGEVEQLKNNNADLNRWLTERDDKITEMEAERVMWEQVKDSYERSQTKDKTSDRKNTAVQVVEYLQNKQKCLVNLVMLAAEVQSLRRQLSDSEQNILTQKQRYQRQLRHISSPIDEPSDIDPSLAKYLSFSHMASDPTSSNISTLTTKQ